MRISLAIRRLPAIFTAALTLLGWEGLAQVLPFEIIGSRQGLPQSQVADLTQDAEGYLWVGTMEGLARYNGNSFRTYYVGEGIGSGRVYELLSTRNSGMYAATGNGISVWRDHQLREVPLPSIRNARCRALAEDAAGNLWIGSDSGIVVGRDGTYRVIPKPPGADKEIAYDLLADQGRVLAVCDTGLWRISTDGSRVAIPGPPGLSTEIFRCVAVTPEGLWLGTYTSGLWLQTLAGWEKIADREVSGQSIYRLSMGPSGTFYVACNDAGLFLRRPGSPSFEHWSVDNGLPSNVVNVAYEDRERNLWVATDIGGLARLGGMAVSTHGEKQGLPSACIFGISSGDSADSLWIATLRGAVHYQVRPVPRVLESIQAGQGLANEWIWRVLNTPDGMLWVLSDSTLFFRLPGERSVRPVPAEIPAPRLEPWDIMVDRQGRLWVSGMDNRGGLAVRDGSGKWTVFSRDETGAAMTIAHRIASRGRGGVWFSSYMTIRSCDGKTISAIPAPPLPNTHNLTALFEDSRGRLWAGADTGLAVRETDGRWILMNDLLGFTNKHVYFIGEDRDGQIWVGTTRGAFIFQEDGRIQPFNPEDGLADWETNQHGFFCDARGEIWLGTINGLSQFNPANRRPNSTPPRVVLESADTPERSVPFPGSLELAWGERNLTFRIALLTFRNRARTGYRFRLEGLEDDWQPLGQNPELRYTNLPPGRLTLHLQAVNESGTLSQVLEVPIIVHPPFWRTSWFQGFLAVGLLVSGLGGHRWRMSILKRRNRELEAMVAKRTEDLRSANDQLSHMATHEPLTGLLNRRAITDRLTAELQPGGRPNRQFGVVLVDLNKFKPVNDTLGHNAGDQVLREMAGRIQGCLRDSDVLGRWGGDEFLVLMPRSDWEAVSAVCRRISQLEYPAVAESSSITVTASCGGVAVPGRTAVAPAAVLAAADELMYKVKRAGGRSFEVRVYEVRESRPDIEHPPRAAATSLGPEMQPEG